MPKLIAANWKENPRTEAQALKLFQAVAKIKHSKKTEIAICPPFIYLEKLAELRRRGKNNHVALGAQDVFWEEKGPYTSEVGPKMLRSLGVSYVIVGHSERRKWLKETDAMINKKIKLAQRDGLKIILCVGESFGIRKKGIAASRRFVADQLRRGLAKRNLRNIVIAYEPIWAIGTGRYDDPRDACEVASFIKAALYKTHHLKPRVLYGGSVNGRNIEDYVQYKEIDGALVGGASLRAGEFKKMINVVQKIK
jgi:triosephosphate isomerase